MKLGTMSGKSDTITQIHTNKETVRQVWEEISHFSTGKGLNLTIQKLMNPCIDTRRQHTCVVMQVHFTNKGKGREHCNCGRF